MLFGPDFVKGIISS